jgi:hypothetical protein
MAFYAADAGAGPCKSSSMKKHIRTMIEDLKKKRRKRDRPPSAVRPVGAPQDLEDQELSSNPAERVRQLDEQAQEDEERETLE